MHRIKAQDINPYHELLDEIINNYLSKDPKFDLEGRVREVQALYKKEAKQELSREEAIEEIVANSVIPALSDRQFIESIVENKKTLAVKISEWVNELINELNKILDRLSNIAEVREVRKDVQLLENIRNIIDESVSKTGGIRALEGESRNAFLGYAKDGKGVYVGAFPAGTPKAEKANHILNLIKTVWSHQPIKVIMPDGSVITANYDATYEKGDYDSDASKLMGGNKHGNASEKRVTLDLADDYPQLLQEATYNGVKEEVGKDTKAHKGVKQWHYFYNNIYYSEFGKNEYFPYVVSINVKEKSEGYFVYSYSAEKIKGSNTPQTLHAVVSGENTTDIASNDRVSQSVNDVNNKKYSVDEPESEITQLKDDLKAAQIREENLSSTISTQQQIIKSLKAEFEITKGHILSRNKIDVLAKKLLYKYSSSYDSTKLSDNLQKLFDYIANDKNVDWYSVMDVSSAIAKEILAKSTRTNRDLYNQYADMREYFRKTKFNIPEEIRAEEGEYYGGWNNFRRQNFGRFNLTNEGYSLDSYWNEISEMYPEFFDAEATPQEQVVQVVEALESVQPYAENPFKLNMDE